MGTHKGTKLRTFRQFKNTIKQEKYLSHKPNINLRNNIPKLRLSAHNLPVETRRYKRQEKRPLIYDYMKTAIWI